MLPEVKNCVDAKLNHLEQYFEIPAEKQAKLDDFRERAYAFADPFKNAAAFENAFAQCPLSQEYAAFFSEFPPKAYKMTSEDRKTAANTAKAMFRENKKEIAKDLVEGAVSDVSVYAREKMLTERRERMIEEGVFDDYTRTSNKIDRVARAGKFLSGLFKK